MWRWVGFVSVAVAAAVVVTAGPAPAHPRAAFYRVAEPAWAPDGKRIVFAATDESAEDPTWSLYVMNAGGSGIRRLTQNNFDAESPSWSPDGRSIAFTHTRPGHGYPRDHDVYVIRPDGSGQRSILPDASDPAWSPGGRRIAYAYSDPSYYPHAIMTAAPDGSARRQIAEPQPGGGEGGGPCDGYFEPTWSPDGEFVAFSVQGEGGECDTTDDRIEFSRGYGAKSKVLVRGALFAPEWSPRGGLITLSEWPYSTGVALGLKLLNLLERELVS